MDQPTILIISDDVEFSRAVSGRWQSERLLPAFTLMSPDLCQDLDGDTFELAIAGAMPREALLSVVNALEPISSPAIFVLDDPQLAREIRQQRPGAMSVQKGEDWLDALVMLASETLRRCEAVARARRAELANADFERHATLGRYMLEARHSLNNALTSVLGNSELLLLEPGSLSAETRPQVETIRNMALRMHEILQRFTSIDKEMTAVEKVGGSVWSKARGVGAAS